MATQGWAAASWRSRRAPAKPQDFAAGSSRRQLDRIDDGDDAAFGRRKFELRESAQHALSNGGVRKVRTAIGHAAHLAISSDHEAHYHPSRELVVAPEPLLIALAKHIEVLAHHALNHLGRQSPRDGRGPDSGSGPDV